MYFLARKSRYALASQLSRSRADRVTVRQGHGLTDRWAWDSEASTVACVARYSRPMYFSSLLSV